MHDGLDNDPLCDEHEQPAAADGDAQRVRRQDLRPGLQLGHHRLQLTQRARLQ